MNPTHHELQTDKTAKGAPAKTTAQQLIGFTNNLVATSVVVVVALVVGTQLISLWGPDPATTKPVAVVSAWPTVEDCAIEFGDRPYSLIRQQVTCDENEVVESLRESCQQILYASPTPSGPIGNAESRMIEDARELVPIAADDGKWRIFQVKNPEGKNVPMVIGLRDDCPGQNQTRMVTWGLAIATNETDWNLFVCSTSNSNQNRTGDFTNLIPPNSKKTLGISSEGGSKLIGFTGGDPGTVKRFFDRIAERENWNQSQWEQNGSNWQCSLFENDSNKAGAIRVQFAVDDHQNLRGLLVVEPNTMMGKPE